MTAIWHNDGAGWQLVAPSGFTAEAALHDLVEQAPQMLPLSGSPRLTIVGREVILGNGKADLLAVEASGRLAIIEIKLSNNAESRRAVVAQVLAYAAFLHGWDATQLEQQILQKHLDERKYTGLLDAVTTNDQEGSLDATIFSSELRGGLALGAFRLVFVLDEAPPDLIRLVGYLEAVTDKLVIDLVTVSAYSINGAQALVPQRIETTQPENEKVTIQTPHRSTPTLESAQKGWLASGADDFAAAIVTSPAEHREKLTLLYDWAKKLEGKGWVKLSTFHGKSDRLTLLPRLSGYDAGLVTIWNDGGPAITVYRSVFERFAPSSIPDVVRVIHPVKLGKGNAIGKLTPEVLDALEAAYAEAASKLGLNPSRG